MAITTQLEHNGRLGNQLFQLAATYAHSRRMNEEFICPKWKYAQYFPNFKLTSPFKGYKATRYREKEFTYSPIPLVNNLDLQGYFQSEKYFIDYKSEIMNLFQFDNDSLNIHIFSNVCAIHVRRGDYINSNLYVNLFETQYYKRAINMMNLLFDDNIIFRIFSDDIHWCQQQEIFNTLPNVDFYVINVQDIQKSRIINQDFLFNTKYNNQEIQELWQIRLCNYHIIANSTYSWWGAYLANSRQVIAPINWFKNTLDSKDIVPENWLLIE